jgi:hypothetical protein
VTTPRTADVRAWARENGITIADRGRLPRDVLDAYAAAHGGSPADAPADRRPGTSARPKKAEATASSRPKKAKATASRGTARSARGKRKAGPTELAAVGAAASPSASTPRDRDAAAPADQPSGQDVEERLQQVEAQLAAAVARLTALESRTLRSLLGLRITL